MSHDTETDAGQRADRSISLARANLLMLAIAVPLVGTLAAIYGWRWGSQALWAGLDSFASPAGLAAFAIGILAHEAIHVLSWAAFGRLPLRAFRLGFQLKTFTPYAHSKRAMPAGAYRIGAFAPGLALGILPALLGIATGNGWIFWFGLIFTFTAGGDLLVLWIIRGVPAKARVEDHPSRAGCIVLGEEAA